MPANVPGGYEIRPYTPSGSMLVIHPGTLRQPSGARVVEDADPYRRGGFYIRPRRFPPPQAFRFCVPRKAVKILQEFLQNRLT